VAAWNHEWAPGVHTLALFGRLVTEQDFADKASPQYFLFQFSNGAIAGKTTVPFDVNYKNTFTIYSGELNQIIEWNRVTITGGGRYQAGTFEAQDLFTNPGAFNFPGFYNSPAAQDEVSASFERISGYGYLTLEPVDRLWLIGGVAYDQVTYPDNFRQPPLNPGEDHRSQTGPKAALVWNPIPEATLRGVYTRSLGGVSLDESYRLEPTQLAGFPQAFRSLISESLVGSVDAPTYETLGVALDLKLGSRTYAGIDVQRLRTTVQRNDGVFALAGGVPPAVAQATPELLNYQEYQLNASVYQLAGDDFVFGAGYHLTQARLHDDFQSLASAMVPGSDLEEYSRLHQISAFILFNHPSGFFAKSETDWYEQENEGWNPVEPGDEFFQQNFYAGYRLAHRRIELTLGLLNVTSENYKLSPLTVYEDLPRKRVLEVKANFVF
jgi:hypothetical protein